MLEAAAGSIAYRFEARDLNLVLAPPASGGEVRFTVRLDGSRPATRTASTSTRRATGAVAEPRMYQLVRQRGAVASAPSRSRSSIPACAPTSSPSASCRSRAAGLGELQLGREAGLPHNVRRIDT